MSQIEQLERKHKELSDRIEAFKKNELRELRELERQLKEVHEAIEELKKLAL